MNYNVCIPIVEQVIVPDQSIEFVLCVEMLLFRAQYTRVFKALFFHGECSLRATPSIIGR